LLWVLCLLCWCAVGCWLNPEPRDDLLARCDLKETLSSEFARRTGLFHVCSSASNTTCLALLLLDRALVQSLGYAALTGFPPSSEQVPSEEEIALKDHVDLGFLPRVTRDEFVRLYAWASYAHTVEGWWFVNQNPFFVLFLFHGLQGGGGKVLFDVPLQNWKDVRVAFEKEQFIVFR